MTELLPFRFKSVGGKEVADEIRLLGREGKVSLEKLGGAARGLPRAFERIDRAAATTARGIGGLGAEFGKLRGVLGTVFAGLSVERLARVGAASLQTADDIGAAAAAAGINAERFQSLVFAFEQFDVSATQTADGLRRLGRRFGEFRNSGAGPAAAAIRALGLEQEIASGKIADSEQFLDAVIDRLGRIDDGARVAAFAAQLFGDDAGPQLAVALRQGTAAIAEQEDRARSLGLVIDGALVQMGARANKELAILHQTFRAAFDAGVIARFAAGAGRLDDRMSQAADTGRALGELLGGTLRKALENVDALLVSAGAGLALLAARTTGATAAKIGKARASVLEAREDAAAAAAALKVAAADRAAAAAALERARAVKVFVRPGRSLEKEEKRLAAATVALTAAQERHTAAMARARVVARGLRAALAFVGGVPGLVFLGASAAAMLLLSRNTDAAAASAREEIAALEAQNRALEESLASRRDVARQKAAEAESRLANAAAIRQELEAELASARVRAEAAAERLRIDAGSLRGAGGGFDPAAGSAAAAADAAAAVKDLERRLEENRRKIAALGRNLALQRRIADGVTDGNVGALAVPDDLNALFAAAARRLALAEKEKGIRAEIEAVDKRLLELRKRFPNVEEATLRRLVAQEVAARKLAERTDARAAAEERAAGALAQALARAREQARLLAARRDGKEAEIRAEIEIERLVAAGVAADDERLAILRQLLAGNAALTNELERQREARRAAAAAERELARQREQDFRDLSDSFFDLFAGRGLDFWSAFKAAGLRALADLAAASFLGTEVAAAAATRRGGLLGNLFAGFFPSDESGGAAARSGRFARVAAGAQRAVAGAPDGFFLGGTSTAIGEAVTAASRSAAAAASAGIKDESFLGTLGRSFSDTFRREFREFGKLAKETFGRLGIDFGDSLSGLTDVLGQAGGGAGVGFATTSILKGLGLDVSRTGGAIGGAIGSFLPIPGGSVIGSVLGSVLGGLFSKTPQGGATAVSNEFGRFGVSSFGRGQGREEQAVQLAFRTISTIEEIARTLGGSIAAGVNLGTIGTRGKKFVFDPSGQGRVKGPGVRKFGSQEEALAAQLAAALSRGIVTGVGQTAARLLREATAGTIEQVIEDAAKLESVPRRLKAIKDPVGAALDELNREFTDLRDTFLAVGATTQELAQLEELFGLERERVLKEQADARTRVLKDFLAQLTVGDASPLALRDQRALVRPEFEALAAAIEAGKTVDQEAFAKAAGELLDIERTLNGSTADFFAVFERVRSLAEMAIENATRNTGREDVPNPFPDLGTVEAATQSTARDTAAMRDLISRGNELLDRISRQLAAAPAGGGGFVAFDRRAFLA